MRSRSYVERVAEVVAALVPEGGEADLGELIAQIYGSVRKEELMEVAKALMGKLGVVWDARLGRFIIYKPRNPRR